MLYIAIPLCFDNIENIASIKTHVYLNSRIDVSKRVQVRLIYPQDMQS